MIEEIPWDNYIEIKTQEINSLKQEIKELESKVSSPMKKSSMSDSSFSSSINAFDSNPQTEPFKDIFFRYATVFKFNEIYIDLTNFKLVFTELNLGGKDVSWKQAELIFYSVSKRSNIDYEKFLKILKQICLQRFKNPDLHKILPLFKIPEKRVDVIDKNILVWREEASSGKVREVISGYEELLRIIYAVYGSKDVKHQQKLVLANLLELFVDCKVVPAVVSKLEVSRVFRAVEYGECLGYEEFLVVFASISILGMGKMGICDSVEAVKRLLDVISENSEFIYTKKNHSNRWID